jgi:type IV pilus assembly protein PilY1
MEEKAMKRSFFFLATISIFIFFTPPSSAHAADATYYSFIPPFLTDASRPMVMLTMARDHRLYYEAYNDASDINEDGTLDVRYNPNIDYYGYFDSYKYYEYNSTNNGRFEPTRNNDKQKDTTWLKSILERGLS